MPRLLPSLRTPPVPNAVIALTLAAALVAACGGGSSSTPVAGEPTGQPVEQPTPAAEATSSPASQDGSATDAAPIVALVPADAIQTALGESPAPDCDTSVMTGAGSCVWTAADGSWLKVEDSTPQEMPDLGSFTTRVTGALGLDTPVDGLGEAAYVGTSSRGTRIAVFMGDGRVVWVVLNRPGDSTALVTSIATAVTAGL